MICHLSPDTVVVGTNNGLKILVNRNGRFEERAVTTDFKWVQQPFRAVKRGRELFISNGRHIRRMTF